MESLNEFLTEWHNDMPTILVHTSGSTGKPKPLYVDKEKMRASARITCNFLGLYSGDTALLCMPLDYIAGKMVVVRSLVAGMRLISVEPDGHPLKHLNEIPTFAAMTPMQVYNTLQNADETDKLRKIRHLIIGGGAVSDDILARLKDFPHAVWSTYGMTETLSHIALRRLNGEEASEWYVPFDEVEVSTNPDGCLVINAPQVCDVILTTHDMVKLHADGRRFKVVGRLDNVIDSGGIKIQIEEVEKALQSYLDKPYMITRQADAKFGEIVVLISEGHDVARITEICHSVLPKYWQPKRVITVEHIPLTATGKPARAEAEKLLK